MSTGIGRTQRRILDELAGEQEYPARTIKDLASRVGVSDRQVRTAVRALEHRGLVVITKESIGWKGEGQYGRRNPKWKVVDHPDGYLVRRWDDHSAGLTVWRYKAEMAGDDQWVRCVLRRDGWEPQGTPTAGLLVWLPECREQWEAARAETARQIRAAFGLPPERGR